MSIEVVCNINISAQRLSIRMPHWAVGQTAWTGLGGWSGGERSALARLSIGWVTGAGKTAGADGVSAKGGSKISQLPGAQTMGDCETEQEQAMA
jgi:hypothetical protein